MWRINRRWRRQLKLRFLEKGISKLRFQGKTGDYMKIKAGKKEYEKM